MNILYLAFVVVMIAAAWAAVALGIGYLERGHEQSPADAEDHNGD